jgi:hypothetical protein
MQGKATRPEHMPMQEQGPGNQRPLGGVQAGLMHKVKTPGIFSVPNADGEPEQVLQSLSCRIFADVSALNS